MVISSALLRGPFYVRGIKKLRIPVGEGERSGTPCEITKGILRRDLSPTPTSMLDLRTVILTVLLAGVSYILFFTRCVL